MVSTEFSLFTFSNTSSYLSSKISDSFFASVSFRLLVFSESFSTTSLLGLIEIVSTP